MFSGCWQPVRGASGGCEYRLAFAIPNLVRSNILLHVSLPAAPTLRNLRYSRHPDIQSLAEAVPGIIIQDRAPSTVRKYSAAFLAWQKGAEPKGIKVLPASGPEFSLYLVYLLQTTDSLASIQAAAFGVAWAHQKACLPSPSHHTLVKQLLEACARILGTCPKNRKMPITADQVKEVVRKFGCGNLSELQITCLISMGFAAFLCWDDLKDLRHCHLLITGDHMAISLAKRKNDQFREGSSIQVVRSHSSSCPVAVMERFLLAGRHPQSNYLFRKICHTKHSLSLRPQPLTYSRASELIRKQLKAIGLNPKQYGLHSLRSRRASTAAAAAIPNRLLMRHGGWRLESAKNTYIQETEETLVRVSRALWR